MYRRHNSSFAIIVGIITLFSSQALFVFPQVLMGDSTQMFPLACSDLFNQTRNTFDASELPKQRSVFQL